ncbi:MAG: hypothetical protein NVS1B14_12790 [Vulcanimicrobiaceae bacterium]
MTLFLGIFSHLAAAILCAAVGFIIWDIGTRSPARVISDVLSAVRANSFFAGLVRFAAGLVFVGVSVGLVFFSVPLNEAQHYTLYQMGVFIVALAIELLVGDDVRPLFGLNRRYE